MAAGTSGSFEITSSGIMTGKVEWSETYEASTNTHIISIDSLQFKNSSWYGYRYYLNGSVSVNGTPVITFNSNAGSHSFTNNSLNTYAAVSANSASYASPPWKSSSITGNSDGSCAVTISVDVYGYTTSGGGGSGWRIQGSSNIALTTVPRASAVTMSSYNFAMGDSVTIYTNRVSSSFTHTITYSFGSASGTIASNVEGSAVWSPSLELAQQIPNAVSGTGTVTCYTYNGSTHIGTASTSFTLAVPSTVVPSAPSISVVPSNSNDTVNGWGIFLQGYSKANISVSASGSYGSAISSYSISCNNQSFSSASATTGILNSSGYYTVSAIITDSRGRSSSAAARIYVYPYAKPSLNAVSCYRCSASGDAAGNGTFIYAKASQVFSNEFGKNSCRIGVRYRTSSGSFGGYSDLSSGSSLIIGGGSISLKSSYVVQFTVSDALNSTNFDFAVPTETVTLNLKDGGMGVGIGKYAEEDNLMDVGFDAKFRGAVAVDTDSAPMLCFYLSGKLVGAIGSNSSNGSAGNMFIRVYNDAGNYKEYTWSYS